MRKRRITYGIALAVIAIIVVAIPVVAAYSANVMVLETQGNSYTMYPIKTPLNTTNLVDQNIITATGLDTRVNAGGTAIPHMLTHDSLLFADAIPANSSSEFQFTTGNTALSDFYLLTGDGGFVTMDDDAALEPTDDFEIEFYGDIDTTAVGEDLVLKDLALRIYINAVGTIRAAFQGFVGVPFPQVETINGGNNAADNVNHTVNLPAGINAGDLLIAFFASDSADAVGFPGGWVQLFDSASGWMRYVCYYRIADGGEGATINVTTANPQKSAHTTYRISGYSGVPEAAAFVGPVANANPDPPNLAPTWGAMSTLWLANCGYQDGAKTVAIYPANYINGRNDWTGAADGAGVGSAERDLSAANENPGTFTLSGLVRWIAGTVAIKPAPGDSLVVEAINVPVGVHEVNVQATGGGGDLIISVDSAVGGDFFDDTPLAGATVTDNNNDWVLMQNVSAYWDYYEHTVASVLIVDYEPVAIILGKEYSAGTAVFTNGDDEVVGASTNWTDAMVGSTIMYNADDEWVTVLSVTDTTHLTLTAVYAGAGGGAAAYTMNPLLPDKQGAVQNGIITWGVNANGISVIWGSFGLEDGVSPSMELIVPDVAGETGLPEDFILSEGDMSGTGITVFYPIVNWIATQTNTPITWLWWAGGGLFVIFCILVAFKWLKNIVVVAGVGLGALGLMVAMSVFPAWLLIPAFLIFFGTIIQERSPST